jgi:hypothetical protein
LKATHARGVALILGLSPPCCHEASHPALLS